MKRRRTLARRLIEDCSNPRGLVVKVLQDTIDHLVGYSYDVDKNGERRLLEKMELLGPKVIFDVGAHVGDWALRAAVLHPDAAVHCFELSPSTCQTLVTRLVGPPFIVNECGMGDHTGDVEFKDYGANVEVNTLLQNATYHDEWLTAVISKARITTGDDYCRRHDVAAIDLLKIDVEGADHLVLAGFAERFAANAIRVVQFEYGYANGDAKFLMRDFYDFFAGFGYAVGRLGPRGVAFAPWNYEMNDFRSGPNYVAVAADDADAIRALARF